MSFWSALGKIGAGIAAPFTGGASLAAIPAIDAIGKAAGGAAGAMANNRGAAGAMKLDEQAQFEQQLLAREEEKRRARNDAMKQSVYASLLGQFHPGARPAGISASPFASLGAGGTMAANEVGSQSMRRLLQPDLVNPSAPPALTRLDLSKELKPSLWEKLLGAGSVAAPLLSGVIGSDRLEKY